MPALTKTDLSMLGLGGGSLEEMLRPNVTWFLDGCPAPRPQTVDELVTLALIVIGLIVWHIITNRDPKIAVFAATIAEDPPHPPIEGVTS